LVVALPNPLDTHLIDDIRMLLKRPVSIVVSTQNDIEKATKSLYEVGPDTVEKILHETRDEPQSIQLESQSSNIDDDSIGPSIVKFVNVLIREAIESDATDIHIELFENELRVRYRIDSVLHSVPVPYTILGLEAPIVYYDES